MDLDRLWRDVRSFFRREDVATVVLDLASVRTVDSSLINLVRSLAIEGRMRRRGLRLSGVPAVLQTILSSGSHRLSWAVGLMPPDPDSPAGRIAARSLRGGRPDRPTR